jgi:hypothetical protein
MGEGSTAVSQGFAPGMCCISRRAAVGAAGAVRLDRFHTDFTHERPSRFGGRSIRVSPKAVKSPPKAALIRKCIA